MIVPTSETAPEYADDIEEVDEIDATEEVAPPHPWVPIPPVLRGVFVGILAMYTLVCVFGAILSEAPSGGLLAVSNLFYLVVLAIPLIAYDREEHGWFHPLIFATLFTMLTSLPRRMSFLIFGLDEHAVLPLPAEDLTRLVAYENLLMGISLLSLYAGFYFIKEPALPRLRLRQPKNLWMVVGAVFAIAFIAIAAFVRMSGSFSQHVINLSLNSTAKQFATEITGIGHLATAAQLPAWILTIVMAYKPEYLRKVPFLALCFLALLLVYLATGKRSLLLAPVAVGSIVWMMTTARVPLVRLAMLGVGVFAVFSFLLLVRGVASSGVRDLNEMGLLMAERSEGTVANSLEELSYRSGSYASIYPILHSVPSEVPLLLGESYLTLLARPIPRVIWPTKPRGTDYRTGVTFYNSPWGVPPGPIGEAYWNFHIPGVIGIFFLFGVFKRWLHNLVIRYGDQGIIIFFYAFTTIIFAPSENTITQWMLTLLPALLFGFATGILRPSEGAGHH